MNDCNNKSYKEKTGKKKKKKKKEEREEKRDFKQLYQSKHRQNGLSDTEIEIEIEE